MKLRKKNTGAPAGAAVTADTRNQLLGSAVNRRTFLRNSGITAGGAALAIGAGPSMLRKASAASADTAPKAGVDVVKVRSICTHCSVGCGVIAEVQNGIWTGQEPD